MTIITENWLNKIAKSVAYQYTALQVLLNTEHWLDADEEEITQMAGCIMAELWSIGLIE